MSRSPQLGLSPTARDSLRPPSVRRLSVASDGYDYSNAGSAPEDETTQDPIRKSPTTLSDELEISLTTHKSRYHNGPSLRIFTRKIDGAWRPRVPGLSTHNYNQRPASNDPNVESFEILHNWTKQGGEDDTRLSLTVLKRGPPQPTQEQSGHIRWIHANHHTLSHDKFQGTLQQHVSHNLAPGIWGMTRRLLKRIRDSDERYFVGGKFLIPTAVRYDGQSKASIEPIKPCTFFNFPYISLEEHRIYECLQCKQGGMEGHPKRTLLQSRYRLERTALKDEEQSVTTLSREKVKKCIGNLSTTQVFHSAPRKRPLLHIPQMWFGSLSGDVMVTSGPLTSKEARSTFVKIKETSTSRPSISSGPSLVGIVLEYMGKSQRFTYPADQCDWWFGLLNKQRQILLYLGKVDDDSKSADPAPQAGQNAQVPSNSQPKLNEYKFYTSETPSESSRVSIQNWLRILEDTSAERLDLWLRRDVATPDVVVSKASGSNAGIDATQSTPQTSRSLGAISTPDVSVNTTQPSALSITTNLSASTTQDVSNPSGP